MATPHETVRDLLRGWRSVILVTISFAYLLVAMEWLFFATSLSFLSELGWVAQLTILASAPLPFVTAGLAVVALAIVLERVVSYRRARAVVHLLSMLPAIVLAATLLVLMSDNFSNTLFGFSVQKATGAWRWVWVVVFLAALAVASVVTWRLVRRFDSSTARWPAWVAVTLLVVSCTTASVAAHRAGPRSAAGEKYYSELGAAQRKPNIVLVSADGVDATHMSVYGYARRTTPTLDRLADQSLLCENSFANCANTPGSLMSILTGRLPMQTRVVFPPDILTGDDVYRHLPGLLRHLGYRSMHLSIRYYADAWDLNLQEGFDRSTFRRRASVRLTAVLGDAGGFFFDQTMDRIRDRVRHLFGRSSTAAVEIQLRAGASPTEPDRRAVDSADQERMRALLEFMRDGGEPFLAHVHLMATHGPLFHPEKSVFSRNQRQMKPWRTDFYDDAILEFDQRLSEIFDALEREGQAENTIVVVHSDHGSGWDALKRTPLLFFFPDGAHARRIASNVQNIDIAPTILDYMGMEPPDWMTGRSLLKGPFDPLRPVFAAEYDDSALKDENNRLVIDAKKIHPPFYTMRKASMIVSNRAFRVDLLKQQIRFGDVEGHTLQSDDAQLPSAPDAFLMILKHLKENGYDVSSFGASDL